MADCWGAIQWQSPPALGHVARDADGRIVWSYGIPRPVPQSEVCASGGTFESDGTTRPVTYSRLRARGQYQILLRKQRAEYLRGPPADHWFLMERTDNVLGPGRPKIEVVVEGL